jgi:hypothetical protein
MKILAMIIFSLSQVAFARDISNCKNAIKTHLVDAINHNKRVSPIYRDLTNNRSFGLSATLVSSEYLSIVLTKKIDQEAEIYRAKGVPVLCEDLADMHDVPAFRERLPLNERPQMFYKYDAKKISKKIKTLLKADKLNDAYEATAHEIEDLENYPNQMCMTRHLLESIARSLMLTEKHREEARAQNLPDPKNLIKKFVEIQREGLALTRHLDQKAFPLQKEGFLIYCQDVPPIVWR